MNLQGQFPGTLGKAVNAVAEEFKSIGIDSARLDARLIVTRALGLEPQSALLYPEQEITTESSRIILEMVERRMRREPMAQIFGHREFWSLDFLITADSLIPRPDTETLVEAVLSSIGEDGKDNSLNILDLGTGSGCILLSLLSELPNTNGIGIDISEAAVSVAEANAAHLGLSDQSRFQIGNWGQGLDDTFDIIVSNPPYIPAADIEGLAPEVALYEPRGALDGGEDGLDAYRSITMDLKRLLKPDGSAFFEIGVGQADDVVLILSENGFSGIETLPDLAGIDRVIALKSKNWENL